MHNSSKDKERRKGLLSLQNIVQEGYIEIALLAGLAVYNSSEDSLGRMVLTSGSALWLGLAFCVELRYAFPKQSFFDYSIFTIAYTLGEFSHHSNLVTFLLRMVHLDVLLASILQLSKSSPRTYIGLWILNIVGAAVAFYWGLHLEILESDQLWYVLALGGGSLAIMGLASWLIDQHLELPNILKRKLFHLPPLLLFPLLDYSADGLFLVALTGAFYILFLLELLRYYRREEYSNGACPLSPADAPLVRLWDWMATFTDKRDKHLWVTHLSLFAGMMVTYYSASTSHALRNMSVVIPIGDAVAALVGLKYGRIRIAGKSLEGFLGFVLTTLAMFWAMQALYAEESIPFWRVPVAVTVVGLVELLSRQVDNLLLPLIFLQVYNALCK